MPGLPSGEVASYEVSEWVQEQAQFLSPTQTFVLWYLAANAWHTPDNPEGRLVGDVLSGRCLLSSIKHRTGLSEKAIRNALKDLQRQGYIIAQLRPGNGQSRITVFWEGKFDQIRAEFRSGAKPLPKHFDLPVKVQKSRHLATVVDIGSGTTYRDNRYDVPQ